MIWCARIPKAMSRRLWRYPEILHGWLRPGVACVPGCRLLLSVMRRLLSANTRICSGPPGGNGVNIAPVIRRLPDLGLIYCPGGRAARFSDPFRQIATAILLKRSKKCLHPPTLLATIADIRQPPGQSDPQGNADRRRICREAAYAAVPCSIIGINRNEGSCRGPRFDTPHWQSVADDRGDQ